MSNKQTIFNDGWLTDPEFSGWIGKDSKNVNKARCLVCGGGSFSLGNMGKQALISHAKGKKHTGKFALVRKVKTENSSITDFVKVEKPSSTQGAEQATESSEITVEEINIPDPPMPPAEASTSQTPRAANTKGYVSRWALKEDCLKAETLWAIKTLTSNYSANSVQGNNELFAAMFPDSDIAKQFQCGKTKCSYLISHGIAPYYHDILLKQLQAPGTKYVISFDESLNKALQEEQMDMQVRLWDCNRNRVQTRYFGSQFLGHTRATDLVTNFKTGIKALRYSDLLQISMDGPATNWKFFNDIVKEREQEDPEMPTLLNLGSCGLHVVHGSFKSGASATGWELDSLLRSMWYVFENSPARREDYKTITEAQKYPLRFCSTRWLEDIPVAVRAIEIWPSIVKYVNKITSGPKSKIPTISSFQKLVLHSRNPLTSAKLQFFISVAEILQPFLKKFQTDKPMLPFLAEELYSVLKAILERFIKPAVLEKATSQTKLANIDIMASENVVHAKNVEIGFATKVLLKDAEKDKKVSELQVFGFKKECVIFLQKVAMKLLERSPLKYPVVRYLKSLKPTHMALKPTVAKEDFSKLLEKLVEYKVRDAKTCDAALRQYKMWLSDILDMKKDEYSKYNPDKDEGLDALFYEHIGSNPEYSELFSVVKDMLILSHGQSSVERGFSDNKDIVKDNMLEHTIVSYRQAYDGVKSENKPIHEIICKPLLESCKHANLRYRVHLDENKKEDNKKKKDKEREETARQIEEAKKKVDSLRRMSDKLVSEADNLAMEAEKKNNLSLLVKSNALREKSHGKRKEMDDEVKTVENLEKKLKM